MKNESMLGKPKGRSDYDRKLICNLIDQNMKLKRAVQPLVDIALAYHNNELDDEARKFWGMNDEHVNTTPPDQVELYSGRGGRQFLTLYHCHYAHNVVEGTA